MNDSVTLPQAIFFDWDGTLADSYKFLEGAHNHVCANLGLSLFRDDEFKQYFGQPREKLYVELYGPYVEKAKVLFGEYVTRHHMDHLMPMPGAEDLLKAAKKRGLTMGIISNKKADYLHLEIKGFGWGDYFDTVVGAGDAPHDKPAADPLFHAARQCGILEMEHIWYVGDTDVDLQAANNAGTHAVFIAHNSRSDEWTKIYKPLLIFKNCVELAGFLLQSPENSLKANKV